MPTRDEYEHHQNASRVSMKLPMLILQLDPYYEYVWSDLASYYQRVHMACCNDPASGAVLPRSRFVLGLYSETCNPVC